ncbi:hypothetical protein H9L21_12235 [Aeromicrobium senzhongii]|uniref:Uncharacterized protein n=1 Tax=Aeromicrobium senzhongii TaxID=2663859 RepID=A0ABX6SUD1_9ACTN|nr:hypothetical protein [Aeromicrobium senzhongii]MTB88854.1 hypothetical protein [Aeromicrobium senzhongii]QNL93860.1 hypothetical protein H9L21_12235 [Aeromicrobium senzhongii]
MKHWITRAGRGIVVLLKPPEVEGVDSLMKNHASTAVMSIGFYWIGLTAAPDSVMNAEVFRTGVIGTVAALAAFAFGDYVNRSPTSPPSPPAD